MMQPEGFVDPKDANKVCKAPTIHLWTGASISEFEIRFDEVIKAYGFIQTFGEACIYKKVSGSSVAFLILYVDDILLIRNDVEFLDSITGYLNKSFSIKDLGEATYILGIKIYRDRSRRLIRLSMSTYLEMILKEFKNGSVKEGVLTCIIRCEVESDSMPDHYRRERENERCSLCFSHRLYHVCNAVYQT